MKTFDQALVELFHEGVISLEEALRNADSPNEVRLMIKLAEQGGLDDLGASLEGLTLESTDDGRKMR